jgi:hypothetical protein
MKKASTKVTLRNFVEDLHWYIRFLNKIVGAKKVVARPQEKMEVLEAFVFKVAAVWEVLVSDLLIDCLNKDTSRYAEYMGMSLRKDLPRNVCAAMLTGLNYLDFKSVGDIRATARKVLVPAHDPFRAISKAAARRIDEFFTIRNYLAHYSDYGERRLMNAYRHNHGLTRFVRPGHFLYAYNRAKTQIRFGDYIDAFLQAADDMSKALGVTLT